MTTPVSNKPRLLRWARTDNALRDSRDSPGAGRMPGMKKVGTFQGTLRGT